MAEGALSLCLRCLRRPQNKKSDILNEKSKWQKKKFLNTSPSHFKVFRPLGIKKKKGTELKSLSFMYFTLEVCVIYIRLTSKIEFMVVSID